MLINYYLLNYICGITSIYLLCEILKSLYFKREKDIHYNTCIELLSEQIRIEDVYKICENLNNVTTYQICFYNLIKTIFIITYLLQDNIKTRINYKYWIVSHVSAIIYTLMGKSKMFQFSIDSNTNYSLSRIIILTIVGVIILIGVIRNFLYFKINSKYIINYCLFYLILYLLFRFVSDNVIYHFHHALVCIFISYFFTDWSSKINFYMHSILLGITIQGLNFYTLDEFSMFYISNQLFPETSKLLEIYGIFFFIWFILILKEWLSNKEDDLDILTPQVEDDPFVMNEFEIPLLIPTQEEMLNN